MIDCRVRVCQFAQTGESKRAGSRVASFPRILGAVVIFLSSFFVVNTVAHAGAYAEATVEFTAIGLVRIVGGVVADSTGLSDSLARSRALEICEDNVQAMLDDPANAGLQPVASPCGVERTFVGCLGFYHSVGDIHLGLRQNSRSAVLAALDSCVEATGPNGVCMTGPPPGSGITPSPACSDCPDM